MTVRLSLAVLFASVALFLGACGGGGNSSAVEETSDPLYQQALDLNKQGRRGEALNAFLKLIDRRGENGAPESHLEAGNLYLNWSKDPVEAYHHFNKYLELQPVGPRADMVRGQRDAARRELVKLLPGPSGDAGLQVNNPDEVEQLRRRVHELEAEVQTLRGSSSVPVVRSAPVITMPDEGAEPARVPQIPIAPAGPGAAAQEAESPFMRGFAAAPANPATTRPAPASGGTPNRASSSAATTPRPAASAPAERIVTTPTRPGAASRQTSTAPTTARRTHTVGPADKSLWAIARRYYGAQVTNAQVQGIYQANRDTMRSPSDLRAGMTLRIP